MNEQRKESNRKVMETVLSEKSIHHKFLLSGSNGKLEFNDEVMPDEKKASVLFPDKNAFITFWQLLFEDDDVYDDDYGIYKTWSNFIELLDRHDIAIFLMPIDEDEYDPFKHDSKAHSYAIGEWTELVKTENDWRLYRLFDGLETTFIELDEDEIVKMYNAIMTERAVVKTMKQTHPAYAFDTSASERKHKIGKYEIDGMTATMVDSDE
jgi:hypothetical protein